MKTSIPLALAIALTTTSPLFAEAPSWVFTFEEVSRHSTKDDCWLIIEDKVYDVTRYIPKHPAKPTTILDACGKDATHAYMTKNKGRTHSTKATRLLQQFLVGSAPPTPH